MSTQNDEYVIDLGDLLHFLFKRILIIGAVALAGAIAGGAYAYRSAAPASAEALKAALSDTDAQDVERMYGVYSAKQDQLASASEYIADSALMKLNAQSAPTVTSEYVITSSIPHVWELYASTALRDNELQEIADALDLAAPQYAPEMVTFSGYTPESVLTDGAETVSIMTVKARGYTREQAERISEIAAKRIDEVTDALQASGADIAVTAQDGVYTNVYDADAAKAQQTALTTLADLQNAQQTYRTSNIDRLGADEKAYFNALDGNLPAAHSSVKLIAIGALIGLLGAGFAYALVYLCAGVIRTEDEAEGMLGTRVISKAKRNADAHDMSVAITQICVMAKNSSGGVFVQSDSAGAHSAEVIAQNLSASGIRAHTGDALNDADACAALLEADRIIACAVSGRTKKRELSALMNIAQTAGKRIDGIVLLSEG